MFDLTGLMGGGLNKKVGDYIKKTMGVSDGERPYPSCPKACRIAPNSCQSCIALKEQVKEALYFVDNQEEYYAQFEVCDAVSDAERRCPVCGAPADVNDPECEYCGAELSAGRVRIRVKSKQDIPSPIMAAYQRVHARQLYMADEQKKRSAEGGGFLRGVVDSLGNMANQLNGVSKAMSLSEIEGTAKEYGVSVCGYLEGLDDGTYLTAAGKRALDQLNKQHAESQRRSAESDARINAMLAQRSTSSSGAMDFLQRHQQYSGGTGYMGKASGSCCGNCQYYLMGSNECGNNHFKHPSGASDYCGSYRSM